MLEVTSERLGTQQIRLTYASRPEGQWAGKVYYFGNFGTEGLAEWMAVKDNASQAPAALQNVHNAFVQKWGGLRLASITVDEFLAVLTSTQSESWKWPTMQPPSCPKAACYPYVPPSGGGPGYGEYSDNLDSYPVPSGLVELPIVINLRPDGSDDKRYTGKISSADTLHYAGDPSLALTFAFEPAQCASGISGGCINYVQSFQANIAVGGRYLPEPGASSCTKVPGNSFELTRFPWLLEGFTAGTVLDDQSGYRYRLECRDSRQPFASPDAKSLNVALAASNPLPDGRTRVRKLDIVDGALVNQSDLFIIFKETFFDSFSFVAPEDQDDFTAYGVMVLHRNPTTLEDSAYVGNAQTEAREMPDGILAVGCSEELVKQGLGSSYVSNWRTNAQLVNDLAGALIDGTNENAGDLIEVGQNGNTERVHYLCHDRGIFDSGWAEDPWPCPAGSHVTFFTVNGDVLDDATVKNHPCQVDFDCQRQLDAWQNASVGLRLNPFWRCTNDSEVFCDSNRFDLREGKTFYAASATAAVFQPLRSAVDSAFRYKTAFRSRTGTRPGFAPEVCVPNSNAIPYCYDPQIIEELEQRIDCIAHLYLDGALSSQLSHQSRETLHKYLRENFSVINASPTDQRDGYEAYLAELLVMLGDNAYTAALGSRFDLAGAQTSTFEGSLFEPGGIDLSGVAGREMFKLYQATQYYQRALDRFYRLMPTVWASLEQGPTSSFVVQETVTNYFDRLIRASTQKSRAWSQVASRYQNFNRPELARRAIERAYTSTYLESVLITRLMHKTVQVVDPEDKAQILHIIDQAQRQYKAALLEMRDVYKGLTDEVNYFGFPADYIPFPAIDDGDGNAFKKLLASAQDLTAFAAEKEQLALDNNRAYETDSASFQAELVSIRNNYENQLAQLCGTFTGSDGHVYPAIAKYAYLHERASLLQNPCGFMGNGDLHDAMGQMEIAALEVQAAILRRDNKKAEIGIELDRVSGYCNELVETRDYIWYLDGVREGLHGIISTMDMVIGGLERGLSTAQTMSQLTKCTVGTSTDCPTAVVSLGTLTAAHIGIEAGIVAAEMAQLAAEIGTMEADRAQARFELDQECDIAYIDSNATVATLSLELRELDLEILKAYYELQLAFSEIDRLRNEAKRVEVEQQEAEQMAINIEAARNDPNVRIYKNDSIINADRAFNAALAAAYKATKVFEYYTSQSYAHLDELFLTRMVAAGDYNLENYLMELAEAYARFEEQYGSPDLRVDIVSLRDDVLNIPRLKENGEALSETERLAMFHTKLADSAFLDANGYRVFPFSTDRSRLSPLTRNHKIRFIQAEFVGSDVGDTLGRVYVRQRGTGSVRAVSGETLYYTFPERTAVVNTFFNGEFWYVFADDSVTINSRLRDRPYANSLWELVLNQRDELVNKDINVESLSDIRVYLYYTDFTQL